ncbi:nucleotidyl transferase AbiEii/AbiGii toxin family protein [Anaerostipes faecis]|uniref:nucleotidyl transferase AbiEii/AbiGii toxin family protein n=1 Tax=Anaerostipes faecis TaxID=2880702 RepID=UPI00265A0BAE|nr:nucleotidyl transferase AbiEii/AbiGii toxin family protein [Anaerostipes faecis]
MELTLIIMLSKTKKVFTTYLTVLCSIASLKTILSAMWKSERLSLLFVPPTWRRNGDYYDIYILAKLQYSNINLDRLKEALSATTEKRGSSLVVKDYRRIMNAVKNSEVMQRQWNNYQKDFDYATDIAFKDACDVVVELIDDLSDD